MIGCLICKINKDGGFLNCLGVTCLIAIIRFVHFARSINFYGQLTARLLFPRCYNFYLGHFNFTASLVGEGRRKIC
jgi:hypothetical protein